MTTAKRVPSKPKRVSHPFHKGALKRTELCSIIQEFFLKEDSVLLKENKIKPFAILTFWSGPFPVKRCLFIAIIIINNVINNMSNKNTLKNPVFNAKNPVFNANSCMYRILRRLIWVYTVCQCPFYATLGINDGTKFFLPK